MIYFISNLFRTEIQSEDGWEKEEITEDTDTNNRIITQKLTANVILH